MRYRLASAAVALACLVGPALAQPPSNGVVAAVNDKGRPDKDSKLDTSRRPIDMVEFARVKSGETVVDVWPGSAAMALAMATGSDLKLAISAGT